MLLDIVIPAHNEEGRIDATLAAYRAVCTAPGTRFVVALDDCSDHTRDIVDRHAGTDNRVVARDYPKLGKGGVIMESFRASDADLLAFVDADCATPPAELLRLVEVTEAGQTDGAIAARWHPSAVLPGHRQRPLRRRTASQLFAIAVRRLFGLPYSDTQCGAKVLRRRLVDRVVPLLSSRDLVFDVDLLFTARRLGFRIAEVPTVWVDRPGSRIAVGQDSRRMAASLLRLWLHHRVLPVTPAGDLPAYPSEPTTVAGLIPPPQAKRKSLIAPIPRWREDRDRVPH
ncbi:MAG TPA: glycosyltransferase [Mycobacteriales bacterium]|nr:glycosyltransferase [Mycobacteriales bacterium]